MKHLKIFENFKDIDIDSICEEYGIENYLSRYKLYIICRKYDIENYTINKDGSIDVGGDVDLSNRGLTKFPLKFGYVSGNFDCTNNLLTSLEGSPQSVGDGFYCNGGNFYCYNNQLTSLEGSPQSSGNFYCYNNPVYSLVSRWIYGRKRDEMLEYFIDLDMFRGNSVIFIRLKDFMETFDMEINMDYVKKYYKVI